MMTDYFFFYAPTHCGQAGEGLGQVRIIPEERPCRGLAPWSSQDVLVSGIGRG